MSDGDMAACQKDVKKVLAAESDFVAFWATKKSLWQTVSCSYDKTVRLSDCAALRVEETDPQ